MSERDSLISQILPKTLAGLALWLLIFAAGVAGSGVVFFALYQHRIGDLEQKVNKAETKLAETFDTRSKELNELVKSSKAEIEQAAGSTGSKTNELTKLLEAVAPSIARVDGADINGAPASGSAFVVTSNTNETWLLASFSNLAGSISAKQPVKVRLGNAQRDAPVYSWDPERDLALIILRVGNQKSLEWAKDDVAMGARIWAVGTSPGRFGAAASEGLVIDRSEGGILTDADVPGQSRGGPLLARDRKVLGVLSLAYAPDGLPPSNGWAVPIRLSCQKVLRCPS
jgi:S1-C subfamily serine protease